MKYYITRLHTGDIYARKTGKEFRLKSEANAWVAQFGQNHAYFINAA